MILFKKDLISSRLQRSITSKGLYIQKGYLYYACKADHADHKVNERYW